MPLKDIAICTYIYQLATHIANYTITCKHVQYCVHMYVCLRISSIVNYQLTYAVINVFNRKSTGTAQACGIVAGAAALVLEKFPGSTPAQVKQYLINEATDGCINMDALRFLPGHKGANKLVYVGNGKYMSVLSELIHTYVQFIKITKL